MSAFFTREMLWEAAEHIRNDKTRTLPGQFTRMIVRQLKRRRTRAELSALSDRELRDIGIQRGDISQMVAGMDDSDLGLTHPVSLDLRRPPRAFDNRRHI